MKLHANAALSFRQRERMVRRVVDDGCFFAALDAAARASDVMRSPAPRGLCSYAQTAAAELVVTVPVVCGQLCNQLADCRGVGPGARPGEESLDLSRGDTEGQRDLSVE